MSDDQANDRAFLTALRKSSAPFLPPPLLRFMHAIAANVRLNHSRFAVDYCNDEPSTAMLSSFFLAYLAWRSVRGTWVSTTKRSTAHLGGEEDTVLGGLNNGGGGGVVGGGGDARSSGGGGTCRRRRSTKRWYCAVRRIPGRRHCCIVCAIIMPRSTRKIRGIIRP